MSKSNNAEGIFLMLGASVAFAVMAAATKSLPGKLPTSEIVFIRSFFSTLALLFYFFRDQNFIGHGKRPVVLAARGVIGFTALYLYFWAIPQIHLGTAVMLNYTAPLFAVIASYWVFKEKTSVPTKILIGLSFLGVYLVTAPQITEKPVAFLAALASGILAGMVHLLIRQSSGEEESPLLIIFYFTAICAVGSIFFLPFNHWIWPDTRQWLVLAVITTSSFVGQLGFTYSLRRAPISVVSPFGYITPVIGLIFGFFIWRENPGVSGFLGSLIVVFCGTLLYKRQT